MDSRTTERKKTTCTSKFLSFQREKYRNCTILTITRQNAIGYSENCILQLTSLGSSLDTCWRHRHCPGCAKVVFTQIFYSFISTVLFVFAFKIFKSISTLNFHNFAQLKMNNALIICYGGMVANELITMKKWKLLIIRLLIDKSKFYSRANKL